MIRHGYSPTSVSCTSAAAVDLATYVHPELRPFFAQIKAQFGTEPVSQANLATMRQGKYAAPLRPAPIWTERFIPGPPGSPDVRIYVVNAGKQGEVKPAVLYLHGGGFVGGAAERDLGRNQALAAELDCVVVSVDYRLAPETPFPGALEDSYSALEWLYRHAQELGVDPRRIGVMGESAGGGHAAMLTIAARDRREFSIAYQCLIAPMLDDRTGSTCQKPPYMGAVIWNQASNVFGWTSLLGVPAGSPIVPLGSVPARVQDVRGLSPETDRIAGEPCGSRRHVKAGWSSPPLRRWLPVVRGTCPAPIQPPEEGEIGHHARPFRLIG